MAFADDLWHPLQVPDGIILLGSLNILNHWLIMRRVQLLQSVTTFRVSIGNSKLRQHIYHWVGWN